MKKKIKFIFETDEIKHLALKTAHKNALISFLSVLPGIAKKAATADNI